MAGTKRVKILRPEAIGRWSKGDIVDVDSDAADQYLAAKIVAETDEELYVSTEPEPSSRRR